MKTTLVVAAILAASVCFAQAPVRNDLVATTLPLDGTPKAVPGPYKVLPEKMR
jgi:hypothetical protein